MSVCFRTSLSYSAHFVCLFGVCVCVLFLCVYILFVLGGIKKKSFHESRVLPVLSGS